MSVFLTVAAILGLTALLSFVNERLVGLEPTIGLVVLAFGGMLALALAARWISVFVPIRLLVATGTLHARPVGLSNLLTWGGLRGGLAVAMALSLPDDPQKDVVLYLTAIVVAF